MNSKRIGSTETMVAKQRRVAAVAAGHEIADRDTAVADAPVHRRAQLRIFIEVEFGLMNHRLLGGDGRLRHALGLLALIVGLLGDGLIVYEFLAAREIGLGESEIGARLREIGAHLVERDLERPVVDDEQKIALLHHLAVGKMDLGEVTGDARAHVDRIDGDEAADIFVLIDHRARTGLVTVTVGGGGARPASRPGRIRQELRALAATARAAAGRAASAVTMRSPSNCPARSALYTRSPLSTAAEIVALPRPGSRVPI